MPKLSIQLVVHNEENYIPFFLDSLSRQTFKDWELIIVDNGSQDQTVALLEKELQRSGAVYQIIRNDKNLGFARGHNQAKERASAPYILLQNADMYLQPDVLEKMMTFLDLHPQTAAVAPRLMRWDFQRARISLSDGANLAEAAKAGFTSRIDAFGINLFRNRRALEWLSGEEWRADSGNKIIRDLYGKLAKEVFGVSGALAMYRKKVLEGVLLPGGNFFDSTYHSYKEDVDLAYRLQNAGYLSYVLPAAVVYHNRKSGGAGRGGFFPTLQNKSRQTYFVRFHSYKNHLKTLYKNEYWQNFLLDFPYIFWYELKKFFYLLFVNPTIILRSFKDIFTSWRDLQTKRKAVLLTRKMYWRGIRRWL